MKNHSNRLKNYPSNLGTLNCSDTVRAAANHNAGDTNAIAQYLVFIYRVDAKETEYIYLDSV